MLLSRIKIDQAKIYWIDYDIWQLHILKITLQLFANSSKNIVFRKKYYSLPFTGYQNMCNTFSSIVITCEYTCLAEEE